ncbi:MAG: family 65 glycosyl hydrolase [Lachnospiraceae bacterium]|nr:family 65 glycosyl hydrolase [Lachnospiraceae bacterium]
MHNNRIIIRKEKYDNSELRLNETLFSNANGYIGVRGTLEEGVPSGYSTMRGMYLGGVYEIIPMKQAESLCNLVEKKQTMLNVADTQTIELYVCGERFEMGQGELLSNERILDMNGGFTARKIRWRSPGGRTVNIYIKRMASLDRPQIFVQEYTVKAEDFDGEMAFDSWHVADVRNYSDPDDPRLAAESPSYLTVLRSEVKGDTSLCVSKTGVSGVVIASAVSHVFPGSDSNGISAGYTVNEDKRCVCRIEAELTQGNEFKVIKYSAFSDSIRNEDPASDVIAVLDEAKKNTEALYKKQSDILSAFWKRAGMEIKGDDDLDMAMTFNMYQLFCSAPKVQGSSIAAKGLTGEGYEGHYFWDAEMYTLPFFILTDKKLARNILSFRYETLDKARENAALLGHKKGALYPWRTITGEECSGYFPSGSAAYHINGAVSYAVVSYYLATGDSDYIVDEGEEILIETARLWLDTGNYNRDGKFVINEVTGPDEYTCMVDNNFYTNCAAAYGMKWAVRLMHMFERREKIAELKERLNITEDELAEMIRASENMYLPYDERFGISPQDDSFLEKPVWDIAATPKSDFPLLLHYHPLHLYRYQVCKQADTVLAHFLFPGNADRETMEKSFRYYEKITTHDSSLSTCVFSMQASRLGLHDEAVRYFGDSAKLDLLNLHGNSTDGVHTANMGGAYMALVYGFGGIRIDEKGLSIDPFLPDKLAGYSFRFGYHGCLLCLGVDREEMKVELTEGDIIEFSHLGVLHRLRGGEQWTAKL